MRRTLLFLLLSVALLVPATASAIQTSQLDVEATLINQPVGRAWAIDLGIKASFGTPDGGPPAPLKRMVIRFPHASLNDGRFPTCTAAVVERKGGARCPKGSQIGRGTAVADVRPLLTYPIDATIKVFNGPKRDGGRVLIFETSVTQVPVHLALVGMLKKASGRYGYVLTMDVPPLRTVPGANPAAIGRFDVTVGARRRGTSFLEAPRSCPRGGLPFSGDFTFTDGTRTQAAAAISCTLSASSADPAR